MGTVEIITIFLSGALGLLSWFVKAKLSNISTLDTRVDNLSLKVNTLETKFDVLGDINACLSQLRTDVEIIKHKLENKT